MDNLLMQYLAAAGEDISSGNPIGTNVNAVTNQQITARNYAKEREGQRQWFTKILSAMLGGKMPGAKATVDEKGVNMNLPKTTFLGEGEEDLGAFGKMPEGFADASGAKSRLESLPEITPVNPGGKLPNPFDLGQLDMPMPSGSDLAGLTPADLESARKSGMETAMMPFNINQTMVENLREEQQAEIDTLHKAALIHSLIKPDPLDKAMPFSHRRENPMTLREWKSLPADEKEYMLYVESASRLGDEDIMDKREWQKMEPTERIKTLSQLLDDPELMSLEKELRKSSATKVSIGGKMDEKVALADLAGYQYFADPKWIDDVNKFVNTSIDESDDPDVWRLEGAAKSAHRDKTSVAYIEDKIRSGRGKVIGKDPVLEGSELVWKVKWPSEYATEPQEIRYELGK